MIEELRIAGDGIDVGAIAITPADARALLVLGHGAGAGMRHAFMAALAEALGEVGIASLRYQFPYTDAGRRRIDPQPVLLAAVRAAIAAGRERGLPLFAGGKSMGGRMTSLALAAQPEPDVRGVVFFGFPLHPAGKPAVVRAEHLADVRVPMCFLQGDRDELAPLPSLSPIVARLRAAELHVIAGADHGFAVRKKSGRTDADVLVELARHARDFVARCL